MRVHNIQIGQTIERTLTRPTQQSDLIRGTLTRLEIGQHSPRVKNLTPQPYARAGGLAPEGRRQNAEGRRQKVKMLIFLLNFLAWISRVIPVSKKNATLGKFQTPIVISHAPSQISNLKSKML